LRTGSSELDSTPLVPSDEQPRFLCSDCDRPLLVGPDVALSPAESEPASSAPPDSLSPADAASVPTAPPTPIPSEADLDECEVLLRRAIEMIRSSTRWSQPVRGLTDRMPGRSLTSRVVRIHHDPVDDTYVATDPRSGLSVLRHRDRARLLAMCVRIGWPVVDDAKIEPAYWT
jgi:hypothetical protein